MIPFTLSSPSDISLTLGRRVQARRLDHGWTQAELAARAAVAVDTLKKFERTGQVSLLRLIRLAIALGSVNEFEGLLREDGPQSLRDLDRKKHRRGRTLRSPEG